MDVFSASLFAGAVATAATAFLVKQGRKSRRVSGKEARHKLFQKRAVMLVAKVRQMNPRQNPGRVFAYLRAVDPFVLEEAVLHALSQRGLKVTRNERYTGDGGIDGRFELGGEPWLVQVKRYKGRIRPGDVWSFDALCQEERAKGLFVSTGRTPEEARVVQRESDRVRIISGEDLILFFSGERISLERPTGARPRPNLIAEPAQ